MSFNLFSNNLLLVFGKTSNIATAGGTTTCELPITFIDHYIVALGRDTYVGQAAANDSLILQTVSEIKIQCGQRGTMHFICIGY